MHGDIAPGTKTHWIVHISVPRNCPTVCKLPVFIAINWATIKVILIGNVAHIIMLITPVVTQIIKVRATFLAGFLLDSCTFVLFVFALSLRLRVCFGFCFTLNFSVDLPKTMDMFIQRTWIEIVGYKVNSQKKSWNSSSKFPASLMCLHPIGQARLFGAK